MADRVVKQVRHRPTLPQLQKTLHEKRVAAYARVSTDSDEQMGSVEAQKDYFEKCTYLNLGVKEARDQVETALYLGTLPYIDSKNILPFP